MKNYFEKIQFVKEKIVSYLEQIFKVYGNELLLRLEDYNLLENENNCIRTSTATGFIMEEFIVSKLETYTQSHNDLNEIKVERIRGKGTQNSSYDCCLSYQNVFFMINVKLDKNNGNDGVAAINKLYKDYVKTDEEQEKAYIVLKTYYSFGLSKKDGNRKIFVDKIEAYALEEIDFSNGHKQDNRNWSTSYKPNSGRLQISKDFQTENRLKKEEISYQKTKTFIKNMYGRF